jgi:hypothetical protein
MAPAAWRVNARATPCESHLSGLLIRGEVLATVAPAWLQPRIAPGWLERYGLRVDEFRLPSKPDERMVMAETIGQDGQALLTAIYAADVSSEVLVDSRAAHEVAVVGPVPPDTSWQAREQTGYDVAQFVVDWDAQQVNCP